MGTPWWYLDKDIEMDDKLNMVKTVEKKEIPVSTANNDNNENDAVVQSILDAHPDAQRSTKNCSHLQKIDPCLLIDENSPTLYESFVKAVETFLPPSNKKTLTVRVILVLIIMNQKLAGIPPNVDQQTKF